MHCPTHFLIGSSELRCTTVIIIILSSLALKEFSREALVTSPSFTAAQGLGGTETQDPQSSVCLLSMHHTHHIEYHSFQIKFKPSFLYDSSIIKEKNCPPIDTNVIISGNYMY